MRLHQDSIKLFLLVICANCVSIVFAQTPTLDSINARRLRYIGTHDVLKGEATKQLQFFSVDTTYVVQASFKAVNDGKWFTMETTGKIKQTFRQFGLVTFSIHSEEHRLYIYQSQNLMAIPTYKDYLFLPFTDATNGNETYEVGRYLDFKIDDIKNGKLDIDFNLAYNPSCAYVSGRYNCPVPPKDNALTFELKAGEKKPLR